MKIAILGYGTIGKKVSELAIQNGIEVAYILRRKKEQCIDANMTTDIDDIVGDKNVDTVVECIGGDEPAFTYALIAIRSNKHFISANKKMIVKHYKELLEEVNVHHVSFMYSSACGGGVPWVTSLATFNSIDTINSFYGIMNSTSNYILNKMYYENLDFDVVLKKAQELGYAESDPSDDIDGVDTANKAIISSVVAFNKLYKLEDVFVKGIRYFNSKDMEYLKKNNLKCVLLASGYRDNHLRITPRFVNLNNPLAYIKDNGNSFTLEAVNLGKLTLNGQGAGGYPTASSTIRDLMMIDHPYKTIIKEEVKPDYDKYEANYYIRSNSYIDNEYIKERIDDNTVITNSISINILKKIIKDDDFIGEIDND